MIKGVISNSPYISVGTVNAEYMNMATPSAGMVRYNGNGSCLEVYDGSYWRPLNQYQTIDLTTHGNDILNWASKKMLEERDRKILAESHPAIKAALENLERAEQQLETTIHLSKKHDLQTTS
jgi:hypothetical protein